MMFVIQSLLLLVSGVYYSIDDPAALDAGPVAVLAGTYILDGVRAGPDRRHPGHGARRYDVWPLIVMAVVLIPRGRMGLRLAERYAKRTGKLKRVG